MCIRDRYIIKCEFWNHIPIYDISKRLINSYPVNIDRKTLSCTENRRCSKASKSYVSLIRATLYLICKDTRNTLI